MAGPGFLDLCATYIFSLCPARAFAVTDVLREPPSCTPGGPVDSQRSPGTAPCPDPGAQDPAPPSKVESAPTGKERIPTFSTHRRLWREFRGTEPVTLGKSCSGPGGSGGQEDFCCAGGPPGQMVAEVVRRPGVAPTPHRCTLGKTVLCCPVSCPRAGRPDAWRPLLLELG